MKIKRWPQFRDTPWLKNIVTDDRAVQHWNDIFERTHDAAVNTNYMIYQWQFAIWAQNGVAITPTTNLISNIGLGDGGTHLNSTSDLRAKVPTSEIIFPLNHPPEIIADPKREKDTWEFYFDHILPSKRPHLRLSQRLRRKLSHAILRPIRERISNLNSPI